VEDAMSEVDEFGWTVESRARRIAEMRHDLHRGHPREPVSADVEIELLANPRYIRVGDRFGGYVLYGDDAGNRWHAFVDYGPYLPAADRPAEARAPWSEMDVEVDIALGRSGSPPTVAEVPISEEEYSLWLAGERNKAEMSRAAELRKEMRKHANPVGRRVDLDMWMIRATEGREPDVAIYCGAETTSGKRCWKKIGGVWHTDRGYWFQGQYVPFKESIPTHLAAAFAFRDMGDSIAEMFVRASLAHVDMLDDPDRPDLIGYDGQLNDPKPGDGCPPWLVLGCSTHFNAAIDYPTMREWVKAARKSGKSVSYDCSQRTLGTIDWTASGQ